MEYREVIHIIENKRRFGNLPGVVISEKLLAAVENPQEGLAFVHIAGTNGKGSVAAFLREILSRAGIKAGLFTSPHLIDFTERIQVDGTPIPQEDAARLGETLLHLDIGESPTMFDYALAMALLYFREQGCGLAVLETGLGGRLDSTNAVGIPKVSVITRIGYDHMEALGDTLEKITLEKAGILKTGTKAVLASQRPEVMRELARCCEERGIPYDAVDSSEISGAGGNFSYAGICAHKMNMLGEFQKENAAAAVLTARALADLGYPVTDEAIRLGIETAVWPGRMEIISRKPFLLIDGAHNEDGAAALAASLSALYPGEKFHFVMGVLADKDYKKMALKILPLAAKVTTVTPESGRAFKAESLAEYLASLGAEAKSARDAKEAFRLFLDKRDAKEEPRKTVAFGSLYFIAEVRKILS